jgi:hypothetical protein
MTSLQPGNAQDGRALVVVAHPGRLDEARETCANLADMGLATALVELEAAIPDRQASAQINAAAEELTELKGVREDGIGSLGVGRGATWALLAACERSRVGALVLIDPHPVYGDLDADHPVQPLEMLLNLDAPMLCVYRSGVVPEPERLVLHERAQAFARTFEILDLPSSPPDAALFSSTPERSALSAFLDDYLP